MRWFEEEGKKGEIMQSTEDGAEEFQETVKNERKRAKSTEEDDVGEPTKNRKEGEDKDKKVQTALD